MDNEQFHPRHHEWFSDYTAQEHGTPFRSWLASAYPTEYAALRATEAKPSSSAAPGIDTPEFRKLLCSVPGGPFAGLVIDKIMRCIHQHTVAAIAAAREEQDAEWMKKVAWDHKVIADLRAQIAAQEVMLTTAPHPQAK